MELHSIVSSQIRAVVGRKRVFDWDAILSGQKRMLTSAADVSILYADSAYEDTNMFVPSLYSVHVIHDVAASERSSEASNGGSRATLSTSH